MLKRLTGILLVLSMLMGLVPALAEELIETELLEDDFGGEEFGEEYYDEEEFAEFGEDDFGSGTVEWDSDDEGGFETAGSEEYGEPGFVFPEYDYDELTVGNPTPLEGCFFTDLWGNNTSDMDVRKLLNAFNLVSWDNENSMFISNPAAVSGTLVMDDQDGNRTYLINIYSDLLYSDGSPITSRDYAFSMLLTMSPVISELGGVPLRHDYILGYEEYVSGESRVLSGMRIIDDSALMITIRAEYLPFFYEMGLLDCQPYPISVIAPGCEVKDDGEGAYIDGPFTAELLRKTILDPETGYMSHPAVVSGPYMLTSFDGKNASFTANPYFKGDADGITPMIERLNLVAVENDTMVGKLRNGELGLINKATRQDVIGEGTSLMMTGYYAMTTYPRVGLTFISFCCEKPTVSEAEVRQAIAECLDKDKLISEYAGNYGIRVDGYYGLGQWMFQLISGTTLFPVEEPEGDSAEERREYEETLAAWEALNLDDVKKYDLNTEDAAKLLEKAGWKKNGEGIREKETEAGVVTLKLKMAVPEGNNITECFERDFVPYLKEAGIELEIISMPIGELLNQFYNQGERTVDMMYLGSNFDLLFDPAAHFQPSEDGGMTWNYTQQGDTALYEAALAMRRTQPGNLLEYCQKWIAFQQRFAEVEPMIPIYSNVYFDFYPRILHDYYPSETATWPEAVIRAYISDAGDLEEEEEEELGEDEMFFDD